MKATLQIKLLWPLLAILSQFPAPAQAGEESLPDTFRLNVGAFYITRITTTVQLADSSGAIDAATRISFDQDLGLEDRDTVPRIDGYWRFTEHHRLDFTWWKVERDGTSSGLPTDVTFGDIVIPAGTAVTSSFDQQILKLTYGFSFYNVPEAELGIGAGVYVADIALAIRTTSGTMRESADATAPLPVVGAYMRYNISPRWRFSGKGDFFFLKTSEFDGSLVDVRFGLEHQTFKHVGFGFGINVINSSFEADKGDFRGNFENTFAGFLIYSFAAF